MDGATSRTTNTSYTATGRAYRVTDPAGLRHDSYFDAADRAVRTEVVVVSATTRVLRSTDTTYDLAGNVQETEDARGFKTTYTYDELNRRQATRAAIGTNEEQLSTTVYDPVGNVAEQVDALGRRTRTQYDDRHRATTVIEAYQTPEERTTTTAYDGRGNVRSVSRPQKAGVTLTTSYGYDLLHRVTTLIEAYGTALARTATTVYDEAGNVLSTKSGQSATNPKEVVTSYAYDGLGRRTRTDEAANDTGVNRTTTVVYDAAGNVLAETTGQSTSTAHRKELTTTYLYDQRNRRKAVTEAATDAPLKRTTTTVYGTARDGALAVTDPLGNKTT